MEGCFSLNVVLLRGKAPRVTLKNHVDMTDDEKKELEKAINNFSTRITKIQGCPDPRCKDCKHWGHGSTTINSHRKSEVCYKKRKEIKNPRYQYQKLYYHCPRLSKPCDDFEEKVHP